MKAEYVNVFIKVSTEILNNFVTDKFSVARPYIRQNPFPTKEVIIMVGITGDIRGHAIFSLSKVVAMTIASGMMMGMPVEEIDEMTKSALSELGNMIMGNSATLLFNLGVKIDITPPSFVIGHEIEISSQSIETICVPLLSNFGEIEFDIGLEK